MLCSGEGPLFRDHTMMEYDKMVAECFNLCLTVRHQNQRHAVFPHLRDFRQTLILKRLIPHG